MKANITIAGCALIALAAVLAVRTTGGAGRKGIVPGKPISTTASELPWQVSEPLKFENLTVYPVLSTTDAAPGEYITLDEGLKSGRVIVREIGSSGRARRIRPSRQASADAEVNTLLVTNRSGKTLILIAGELVVGGNQDRIVGHDCLVASGARAVRIDVFCVEHGRWSEDSAFGASRSDTIGASNAVAGRGRGRGVGAGSGRGSGAGGGGGVAGGVVFVPNAGLTSPSSFVAAERVMAAPNVREKAQSDKDQSAVWTEVSKAENANGTSSATGTLNLVFEDKKVKANLDAYEVALKSALPKNAVGVIAAVNGAIVSADVFAGRTLFRAYWPKLLRSLALQATSEQTRKTESPTLEAARAFLLRSGDLQTGEQKRLYRLVERKTKEAASFELEASSASARAPLHFNKVAKN